MSRVRPKIATAAWHLLPASLRRKLRGETGKRFFRFVIVAVSALAASHVPHAVHVFAHGPHSLGLAQDAGEAAIWTTLAHAWIHEQASPTG